MHFYGNSSNTLKVSIIATDRSSRSEDFSAVNWKKSARKPRHVQIKMEWLARQREDWLVHKEDWLVFMYVTIYDDIHETFEDLGK